MKEEELIKYQLEQHQRNQEIDKASQYLSIPERAGFIAGVDWADQHPRDGLWDAEKVCKWLSDRIEINQEVETNSDGEPLANSYAAYCIARKDAADAIIKELRKAMETKP